MCGNATTNAGLTVAVVKDPMTSDYAFEAGALSSSSSISPFASLLNVICPQNKRAIQVHVFGSKTLRPILFCLLAS